jgi:hypothetical protein
MSFRLLGVAAAVVVSGTLSAQDIPDLRGTWTGTAHFKYDLAPWSAALSFTVTDQKPNGDFTFVTVGEGRGHVDANGQIVMERKTTDSLTFDKMRGVLKDGVIRGDWETHTRTAPTPSRGTFEVRRGKPTLPYLTRLPGPKGSKARNPGAAVNPPTTPQGAAPKPKKSPAMAGGLIDLLKNGQADEALNRLRQGAGIDEEDASGYTSLMWAVRKGSDALVQELIAKGADVNEQAADGYTALMFAARRGDVEIIQTLLDAGADKKKKQSNGFTAWDIAGGDDATPALQALLR